MPETIKTYLDLEGLQKYDALIKAYAEATTDAIKEADIEALFAENNIKNDEDGI